MAVNNYVIEFTGLRLHSGNVRQYAVHIQGGSGSEIALKGAASPIVTEEDDDDDIFTPIRTQTGYIRIVDDGKAADGVTEFDWKDLIPTTDTERPVTLTTGNTVLWQGFIQAQTFDGPIYNGPTEREFPIQCVLSALDSIQVETLTGDDHIVNFYGLIYRAFSHISYIPFTHTERGVSFYQFIKHNISFMKVPRQLRHNLLPHHQAQQVLSYSILAHRRAPLFQALSA